MYELLESLVNAAMLVSLGLAFCTFAVFCYSVLIVPRLAERSYVTTPEMVRAPTREPVAAGILRKFFREHKAQAFFFVAACLLLWSFSRHRPELFQWFWTDYPWMLLTFPPAVSLLPKILPLSWIKSAVAIGALFIWFSGAAYTTHLPHFAGGITASLGEDMRWVQKQFTPLRMFNAQAEMPPS